MESDFISVSHSIFIDKNGKNNDSHFTGQLGKLKYKKVQKVLGLPRWLSGEESFCQCRRLGGGNWQPAPVFSPGKSHGQRGLVGHSPQGRKRAGCDWATEHVSIKKYLTHINNISCPLHLHHHHFTLRPLQSFGLSSSSISTRALWSTSQQPEACLLIYLWLCGSLPQHGRSGCGTQA